MKWFTLQEYSKIKPVNVYKKEKDPAEIYPGPGKNIHVLARTSFTYRKDMKSCTLRISADDYYKLYINGRFVTQGPAPAYTEHYYYNEVPVSLFLKEGENCIAVHLYYRGAVNRVWNSGDGRLALAAEMVWKETDSEEEQIQEFSWRCRRCLAYSGELTGYDTQFLENFDSRLWEEEWNVPSFDDSCWEKMVPAGWADYALQKQPTENLCIKERCIQPEKERMEAGSLILGGEITGSLFLKATGAAGSRLFIHCGEELDEQENVRYDMRCGCRYEEIWILKDGVSSYVPYDYKGFRYVQIFPENVDNISDSDKARGKMQTPQLLEMTVQERHYPMNENTCVLKEADEELKRIFTICKNAVKYGTQEGYLDCPTREKGQYLGDAVVTAHSQAWLTGKTDMLRKCIDQFAQSAKICPGLMAVAPGSQMQEIADFSLLWSQLLLLDYRFTGDVEFMRRYYPVAYDIIRYFEKYQRYDGLLDRVWEKWNLVDWPENLRDGYDMVLDDIEDPVMAPECHNVINALYIGAIKTLSEIENILGLENSREWEPLRDAYVRAFYDPEKKLFRDSEKSEHSALHANVYALYFDIVPPEAVETVANFLASEDFRCGVHCSYFVLRALAQKEYYDKAAALLLNKGEHGWINMLREGATCCFEAWGKDQKWNTSLCHPWASAPIPFLIENLAGFHPTPMQKAATCSSRTCRMTGKTSCWNLPFGGNAIR